MGSVVLPHLVTGWHVDQAILSEEERLVVIRFGRDWDPDCMRQDEVLYRMFYPFPSILRELTNRSQASLIA
jgi:DIM1 family U5 snRNP protein